MTNLVALPPFEHAVITPMVQRLVSQRIPYSRALAVFEAEYAAYAIAAFRGNKSRAARFLGIHRNTLARWEKQYGA